MCSHRRVGAASLAYASTAQLTRLGASLGSPPACSAPTQKQDRCRSGDDPWESYTFDLSGLDCEMICDVRPTDRDVALFLPFACIKRTQKTCKAGHKAKASSDQRLSRDLHDSAVSRNERQSAANAVCSAC